MTVGKSSQSGVALAVALIMLVVLTLLALSGVRLSTTELRLALNDELRVTAFQEAQSLVDITVREFTNTPVLSPGTVICARDCGTVKTGLLPASYGTPSTANTPLGEDWVNVIIRGIPPLLAEPPPGTGFSLTVFDASYLQVTGEYDYSSEGRGKATVNEGIAIVYGSAGDTTTVASQNEFGGT